MYNVKEESETVRGEVEQDSSVNRLIITIIIGSVIYIVAQAVSLILTMDELGPVLTGGNVTKVLITDLLFLVLSLGIMITLKSANGIDFGLRMPRGEVKWGIIIVTGLVIGSLATIAIIVTGADGNPVLKDLGIREKILLIWFLASITEEIFVRGLLQGYLNPLKGMTINFAKKEITYPVIISAGFFGMIHVPLILFGADIITVGIILVMTVTLGFCAATLREKYQSISPAIGIHIATNIGGTMLGPIIYAVIVGSI